VARNDSGRNATVRECALGSPTSTLVHTHVSARVGDLENGGLFEPGDGLGGHAFGDGVVGVEFGAEDRAGDVEVAAVEALGNVFDRQVKVLDGEVGRTVEENERSAGLYEFLKVFDAFFADAAGVFVRHRAFRVAVENLVGGL